jgi:FtsP/CotA-like multicopper oxidase with cupredoxin domain
MTATHTEGFSVQPVVTDAVPIGMEERCDVIVTAASGSYTLTALAEGKGAAAGALLRMTGVFPRVRRMHSHGD